MLQQNEIELLQQKIDELAPNEEFTLPGLCGPAWEKLSKPRGPAQFGKYFKEAVRDNDVKRVNIVNDKKSPAIYKRSGWKK